jgi:hypothetical protein
MRVKLDVHQPHDRDERVYTLTIPGGDLMRARFDRFDRLLLADCQSPDATVADSLLALELIVRRIEQAR